MLWRLSFWSSLLGVLYAFCTLINTAFFRLGSSLLWFSCKYLLCLWSGFFFLLSLFLLFLGLIFPWCHRFPGSFVPGTFYRINIFFYWDTHFLILYSVTEILCSRFSFMLRLAFEFFVRVSKYSTFYFPLVWVFLLTLLLLSGLEQFSLFHSTNCFCFYAFH